MSSDLTSLVWRNPTLKGNRKLVMLAFADYSGATGRIFPSINNLVIKTGLAEKTVRSAIAECIEESYLAKKEQFKQLAGGVTQTSNAYKINYQKLIAEAIPIKEPLSSDWSTDVFHDGSACTPTLNPTSTPPSKVTTPPLVKLLPPLPQSCQGNSSLNSSSNSSSSSEKEEAVLPPGAEFRAEPYQHANILADTDLPLAKDLQAQGVTRGTILALLRSYPNRLHIRQSLERMIEVIKRKGVPSPDGFMRHLMNTDPYIAPEEKVAPKGVARRNKDASASAELIQASIQRDDIKNRPETIQAHHGAMSSLASLLPSLAAKIKNRQTQ